MQKTKKIMKKILFIFLGLAILSVAFFANHAEAAILAIGPLASMKNDAMKNLSAKYEGGNDLYLGDIDDDVSFMGNARSFMSELKNGIQFGFKIKNELSGDNTKIIALCPAFYDTLGVDSTYAAGPPVVITSTPHFHNPQDLKNAGIDVDYVLDDGVIGTSITCTAQRFKIRQLLNFIKSNPLRVPEIIIQASATSAFEETMTIMQVTPFRKLGDNQIPLTDYFLPSQFQDKKIIVPTPNLQFDDQTVILLPVQAATELIITLKIGAVSNRAAALDKKAQRAMTNVNKIIRSKALEGIK